MAYFLVDGIANGNGIVPISRGGTGSSTVGGALQSLGITATATELNYCSGTTSKIQDQLDDLYKKVKWTSLGSFTANQTITISSSVDWQSIRVGIYWTDAGVNNGFIYFSEILTKFMFPSSSSETYYHIISGHRNGNNKGYCRMDLSRNSSGDYILTCKRIYSFGADYLTGWNAKIEIEYK